ncbi:peptide-methionine (S)-S-oxide reductase, partial [Streptomyces sp. NPDC055722]
MVPAKGRAVLAGGCFWGMQELFRRFPGVVGTRVGYTGGEVVEPTYRNHGNHAEAVEVTYDPSGTDYRSILEFFWLSCRFSSFAVCLVGSDDWGGDRGEVPGSLAAGVAVG